MNTLTCFTYHLPFATPLTTHKTTFTHRKGIILAYDTSGFSCYAEAAPLPGFSPETLKEVHKQLQQYHPFLMALLDNTYPVAALERWYQQHKIAASLRFALDSLAYQLEAHYNNISFPHRLYEESLVKVPVNALFSLNDHFQIANIHDLAEQGYTAFKAKVGTNFSNEYQQLKKIRREFPDIAIRLDANQGWELGEAINNLQRLHELNIEYCEEPLQNISAQTLKKLTCNTEIPIAVDESLSELDLNKCSRYLSLIILKPMVLGDFNAFFVTLNWAHTHDIQPVVTTSLESVIGRTITSILASGKALAGVAQGLHTGHFLAGDIYNDEVCFQQGYYHIHTFPLWEHLDRSRLKHLAIQNVSYS